MSVGDQMFWEMQDFDFCLNLIKFIQILSNYPNLPKSA